MSDWEAGEFLAEVQALRVRVSELAREADEGRQAIEALRQTEPWYRGLVDSDLELILRFDGRLRLTFVNDACCRAWGRPREDLLGQPVNPLVHDGDWEDTHRAIEDLKTPPHRVIVSNRNRTPQGWRWFEWEGFAQPDGQGGIREVQAVGRDISSLKQTQTELRHAHQKLMTAREEERRRVARDLHDSVAQELVVLSLSLQRVMAQDLGTGCAPRPVEFRGVMHQVDTILQEIRDICYNLYPPALERLGLCAALEGLRRHIESAGLTGQVHCEPSLRGRRLGEHLDVALFRIAQEAVSNAIRHGHARQVHVALTLDGADLMLVVVDDGQGFPADRSHDAGLGLRSMHERAVAVGGRLEIASRPGQTRIEVRTPLSAPP